MMINFFFYLLVIGFGKLVSERLAEERSECDRVRVDRVAGAVEHSRNQRQQLDRVVLREHWN